MHSVTFSQAVKKYRAEYHQHNSESYSNTVIPDDISQG